MWKPAPGFSGLINYGSQQFAIELKLFRHDALQEGKEQLKAYLDGLGLKMGYLILFRRTQVEPADLGRREELSYQGKTIRVIYL